MFSRSKSTDATPAAPATDKVGGKGRPTPSRKEAEAAARARAKVPRTRKEQAAAQRSTRQKALTGLKSGDERYLPARDRGPVKRFVRDFVDARFSFMEVMLPVLVVSMILSYTGNLTMMNVGNMLMLAALAMVVVDGVTLRLRLGKELKRRFPDESHKGTTWYALTRTLQMRFMRLPKPQVKIGTQLPDTYR